VSEPSSQDDEPEMEVIPIRGPTRRRSNAVEEPIESGEIDVTRRSLIIRSQSQPAIPVQMPVGTIVPPLQSGPIPLPQVTPKSSMFLVWLALALIAAAASVVIPLVLKPAVTPNAPNLEPIAALIGTTIDNEARAAQIRIDALAMSSMLRAAIATDAQTLADMARDKDLIFPVKDGETLEVFQIAGDKRASMLRLPASAPPIESMTPNKTLLESRLDGLAIVVGAKVTARDSDIAGEVGLTVPLDLTAVKEKLAAVVDEGIVMGLAMPIVVVKSTGVKGNVVSVPIATKVSDAKLSLSAIVRPPKAARSLVAVRIGGFGLAGLFFLLFLVALLRR
jgi:hypothetical protein